MASRRLRQTRFADSAPQRGEELGEVNSALDPQLKPLFGSIDFEYGRRTLSGDRIPNASLHVQKRLGHFCTGQSLSAGEQESECAGGEQRGFLVRLVTDAFIRSQNDPTAFAGFRNPDGVRGVIGEMVVVTFDLPTGFPQQ